MKVNDTMHPAQVTILHALLFCPAASFAELRKASELTSDHVTFHLKQLIDQAIISKNQTGHYTLTSAGKEYANRFDTEARVVERQPKVAVLLAIEDTGGRWLCQQRLKQPYYGFWGRPSGKVRYGETIMEAAARELQEETGLTADLVLKNIYHKMDYNQETGELLEDKIFFAIYGTHPQGNFAETFPGGRNAWLSIQEIRQLDKAFDGLAEGSEKLRDSRQISFEERQHRYRPADY